MSGLLLLLQDRFRGVGLDALILEISTVVYFVVVGAVAVADPGSALADHTDVVSFGWLAATAWGTLAIRRPFTLGIAKRQTPPSTGTCRSSSGSTTTSPVPGAASFTFIGVSLAVCGAVDAPTWVGIAAHVAGLVGPAVFTKVYPARAQARLLAAQAPVTAVPR